MWGSKGQTKKLDPVSELVSRGQATKENPHQPPWVKKIQEVIALIVFIVLGAVLYNVLMWAGPKIPPAVKDAQASLEEARLAAQTRLDNAAAEAARRSTHMQNPASTNVERVYARGLNGAPGAIICRDYQTVALVFRLYNRSFEDKLQDSLMKGAATAIRGASASEPDPAAFGCLLAPENTPMLKEPNTIVPVVTVVLSDGSYFQGISMPPMLKAQTESLPIGR